MTSFWGHFTFLGPNGLFLGLGKGSKNVLGSTHVVEQLSFCMFLSFLIFDFYLILGPSLTFWGPNEHFFGFESSSTTVLGSTHVVQQILFSIVPSILTFDFYLIFGSFLTFGGPNGLSLGLG